MTHGSLLPIGEFSLATSFPAPTLRHYHSESLLVPAEVDQDTGYRAYAFPQVHRALLITALRGAGIGLRDIRDVLDAPDLLPELLTRHHAALRARRLEEDAALAQSAQLAAGWPDAGGRDADPATSVTRRVPGEPVGDDGVVLPPRVRDAARALRRELVDAGVGTRAHPWCRYALATAADRARVMAPEGPDWVVGVDLAGSWPGEASLPADTETEDRPGRRERVVVIPGAPTMVVLAAALHHLTTTSLELGLTADLGDPRYVLTPDHVELALTVTADPGE
ncbi:MerR family transcriptional regulator [Clavibacter michiganensis]|uniref:MerR family transcriptional regulator n=1 Tax=Clavibacter michiganensis TaxID=28447 RepID=UPI000698E7FB|nr:MerR family transcriptional regulator [Clavibacter michiganensis]AWF96955.1 hypothetical protein BEH61_00385 [Clavibacter michiganensis subsp. insidiosus]